MTMADKSENEPLVGVAGDDSVNIDLDLPRERSNKTRKRKRKEDTKDKKNKIDLRCTNHQRFSPINKEKTNAALGFSENYALSEMRTCLARHDWVGLRQLFPLILGCYSDLEPVVWRYIFTILLYSPDVDSSHLQEFLEMCIGTQTVEYSNLLEHLLTLKYKNS